MKATLTEIDWDTDGEVVELPDVIEIDLEAEGISDPEEEIADWLSDRYGWCVRGFEITAEPASRPGA